MNYLDGSLRNPRVSIQKWEAGKEVGGEKGWKTVVGM